MADDAQTCPRCGAPVWQPESKLQSVAVTPAPVALVLPVPAATPPILPGAERLPLPMAVAESIREPAPITNGNGNGHVVPHWVPPLGPTPNVRSVVVNLPPQRIAPPEAAPEPQPRPRVVDETPTPPTRSATVVPETPPPSPRKPNQVTIAVGTIAPLLAVVVLIVALPAHGAKLKPIVVAATDADAQFDLRALAAAEETSLTATTAYTTDSIALGAAGYQPAPGKPVTILAGATKTAYCLVATVGGTADWYLYDSLQGGLINSGFAAEALAQQACAATAIKSYQPIT